MAPIICIVILFAVCGCGGGGGGGDSLPATPTPAAVNAPPTVKAGSDQFAYGSNLVELKGTAEDSDGYIVSHLWEQYAGPEIAFSGATTPTISFMAPATTGTLAFRYTVTDHEGAEASAIVSVHVSRILYSDSFDVQSNDWEVIDDSGQMSSWGVFSGELYQQNNVYDRAFIESYHNGTFAYLYSTAFEPRSNFRFSVDIVPRANSSGDREGNDIGIMFPYSPTNDYYRLTMNSRYGFTRFEKREGTSFKTIAVNSIGYVEEEQINLTVEVNVDTIVILIDGDPVFAESNTVISPGTVALYCQDRVSFDNVVIADNSPQPRVVISSPLAYSVSQTPRDALTLFAQAVVLNKPVGGSVAFSLDDGFEIASSISGNWHSASLGVTHGEHAVHAILKDADGNELSRDLNAAVGVGGNYIVTVGDSITNGVGDENPLNNDSLDGRMVSRQGFQANLADDLTARLGLPQIVFNEGIPRDSAGDLDARSDSILERHPGANKMLLLIGTNDAAANTPPDEFQNYVESIVNAARVDGFDQVFIARIPPFYSETQDTLNSRVIELNTRIDQIVSADVSGNLFRGPDFYTLFEDRYPLLYDADGVHPNDAGYQVMAEAWGDLLVSHSP